MYKWIDGFPPSIKLKVQNQQEKMNVARGTAPVSLRLFFEVRSVLLNAGEQQEFPTYHSGSRISLHPWFGHISARNDDTK